LAGVELKGTAVFIPARMGASRLPGKPLADINGKPMIVRVAEGVSGCGAGLIAVATDDSGIAEVVRDAGFEAVLTGPAPSGSRRVYEAWNLLGRPGDRIINLQGDEPFAGGAWIGALESVEPAPGRVITLARPCTSGRAALDSSVKVVLRCDGTALYFSRSAIPHGGSSYLEHVGAYCFSPESFDACMAAHACPLSDLERLEQLSWLCAGIEIAVVEGPFNGFGIDTPEDLERARRECR
jgi:3-deoxy-manno-octulosonate cytidylyltransferase (CMP-KDO synthetase)